MDKILGGLVLMNEVDIWTEYGVFLTEEKKGGRDNLTSIMSAAKTKTHVGVDFREANGVKYSDKLVVTNQEREVTLHFALYAKTKSEWLERYRAFIKFLKQGDNGWLNIEFTELSITMKVYYVESSSYKPLTCLWKEGVQASRFKVKFCEPQPQF
jgi:hypothetical protein